MEITKYLCEFFFNDFWHWLGLTTMLCVVCNIRLLELNIGKKQDKKEDKT